MANDALCAACGSPNEAGRKFCGECGASLLTTCASCGTENAPGTKFCGECGSPLTTATTSAAPTSTATPAAERRLVSVLFADLVGFTAASEGRDAEDTRELLLRYFEAARTIVERYGGTVEKFIGDAVMAVWGTPVAQEDDAERAVRAALDLVAAVPELDAALTARAGISTGEAAVTLGAEGQGMVAGDLVNTASRIQSAAPSGAVLVGHSTRRASESAIAYEDVGPHELKGKAEPEQLWRAVRVVAARGGEGRAAGLEAPFVGRNSELRLVKELFHATADEKRARLVSVIGVAGVGKSRLAWEFFKYMDGLSEGVWWHRGRCLAYGDGVAYWALAEMVRGRIGALEDDTPDATARKLHETVTQHFPDPDERAWVKERLLPLVGLGERTTAEQEDLFPAWRRFFERLAEQGPLVLLFEDLHWADAGLIAFVAHLLDWSRNHPILALTLARPEIVERHPDFPGATRSATTLPLEPLSDAAMTELLRGLVPGLPDDLLGRIRERADGIPLYAVETVRMLLDRGLVEPAGNEYRLTGPVAALEVPETLHALIASRLDGLPDDERGLVQDAAVLGQTFTQRGLAALSGVSEDEIVPILASLQRKEVLYVETDPRSPERGQYGFLQALVQRVAYETLARRERRARHLAAATFLAQESGIDTSEIAEVIAAHYLDAFEADPAAADGADVKASARSWFVRAAERALTLAAAAEAQRAFERAAALADDDAERARLLFRAGETALMAGDRGAAERHLTDVIPAFGEAGLAYEQAQASSKLGFVFLSSGRIAEAVERMEESLAVFDERGDEAAAATVAAQLGRFHYFEGHRELAFEYVERSLDVGERLRLPEAVSQALQTKALLLEHRPYESIALMRGAVEVAREHDVSEALGRGYINLGYLLWVTGASNAEIESVTRDGLAYARRRGDRTQELACVAQLAGGLFEEGRWDELEGLATELPEEMLHIKSAVASQIPASLALIDYHRGDRQRAAELIREWTVLDPSPDMQLEASRSWFQAMAALLEERPDDALAVIHLRLRAPATTADLEAHVDLAAEALASAEAPSALGELVALADAAGVPKPPSTVAGIARFRAKAEALSGSEEPGFERAVALLRESDRRVLLAMTLVEQGEWLAAGGRSGEAEPLLAEARDIFQRLGATPWLDRIDAVSSMRERVPS